MKVVLCTHRFLPRFTGGVEIYTFRLARMLQDLGHQVHIVTGEPISKKDSGVDVEEEVYRGVLVSRLRYDYDRRSAVQRAAYNDPPVTGQISALLQKLQPDIVHATSLSLLMAGTIEATAGLGVPLVYTATDFVLTCRRGIYLKWDHTICEERETLARCAACMGPHTRPESVLTRLWRMTPHRISRSLLPRVEALIGKKADFVHAGPSIEHRLDYLPAWRQQIDHIIAPSTHMRDMFVLNDFPPEKITVSPYGVAPPASDFQKIPSSTLRFGFIGRITPIKGVHLLLDAFLRLAPQAPAELTIYGGADSKADLYRQRLTSQVARQAHIKIAGAIDNADITNIYRQLDILVAPSIWPENSPITILEAQAHGIPVIASDVRGIADLVRHEVNGLIFANRDAQDLAAQMTRCLRSPELVAALAKHSRLVRSIRADAGDILELYTRIIIEATPRK